MKKLTSGIFLCILFINSFAQDSLNTLASTPAQPSSFNAKDVYRISWKVDAPVTGAGLGLSVLGLHLIQNKDDLTHEQAIAKSRSDIPSFDRGNAGFYSQKDNDASYIPFFTGFAMPLVMVVVDKTERQQ